MNRYKKIKSIREWIFLFMAVLISVFFIIFNDSSFNDTLSKIGLDAFSILRYDYFSLRQRYALQEEIKILKEDLVRSEYERNVYLRSYFENIKLRSLLEIEKPDSIEFIYAKVTGIPSAASPNTILIDAGTDKKAEKGNIIINDKGMVGIIEQAGNHISKVRLIKHPSTKIPVVTENGKHQGILIPMGNRKAEIHEIIKYRNIDIGEKIFTSDISKVFIPNMLIGYVTEVSDSSATLNKYVRVEFAADFDEINDLFIVKKAIYDE